jgi:hypothetical protein
MEESKDEGTLDTNTLGETKVSSFGEGESEGEESGEETRVADKGMENSLEYSVDVTDL